MPDYDAIVLGVGGAGSAALYHLAQRGARTLGIDRFPPGHDRGSSHGQTRIIRQAYFEHPDYVPLLLRAYPLWDELAAKVGRQLFYEVGLVGVGPPDGVIVSGIRYSARQYHLAVDDLTADEVHRRWGGFHVPEGYAAVFERRAGYLLVEPCVVAHCDAARAAGAELRTGVAAARWSPNGAGVKVETDAGTFTADRLVITAGAWASDLLTDLGVPLEVRRKPLFWYAADDPRYEQSAGCPTFFYDLAHGRFYGFPKFDDRGVKLAEHSGGDLVRDPLTLDRTLHADEQQRIESFTAEHLPGVSQRCTGHAVCMYTMTPDEHFIIDRHAEYPQVVFAAGLSGHGFKFTTVLGEALADLALEGRTDLPVGFLSSTRPALRA